HCDGRGTIDHISVIVGAAGGNLRPCSSGPRLFGRWLAAAAGLALLLSACGGAGATPAQPAATPTSGIAPPTPSPAATSTPRAGAQSAAPPTTSTPPTAPSPPAPAPSVSAATITITDADFGRTITVHMGALLVQAYETSGLRWTDKYDPSVLQPAGTARLRAISHGQTLLASEGRPICEPGRPCPQFIRAFHVTIVVQS
ncbi:MAG: hypothetical protein KGJ86_18930, partial [Chloroflexota bacterium]|nr:hypothetical protein [Chloroflexota bacterium]